MAKMNMQEVFKNAATPSQLPHRDLRVPTMARDFNSSQHQNPPESLGRLSGQQVEFPLIKHTSVIRTALYV